MTPDVVHSLGFATDVVGITFLPEVRSTGERDFDDEAAMAFQRKDNTVVKGTFRAADNLAAIQVQGVSQAEMV
jgi:hypothetical protein